MIGHKKFTWQRAIPPAAEWFDYDRSGKMGDNADLSLVDGLPDDDDGADAKFHQTLCPHCGNDSNEIISTVFGAQGEAWSMRCGGCGKRFEVLKKFE